MDTAHHALTDWALYLATMGWPVFPIQPGTKIPHGHRQDRCPRTGTCAHGHLTPEQYATTDPDRITHAWATHPWNIGIATGPAQLTVLDCDQPKDSSDAEDGATALARLATERGVTLPTTYTVTTPRGGRHLYFTTPPGVTLRNTKGLLATWLDSRATGGYVLGPGSVLPEGGYELEDDTDPVELPGWLVQALSHRPAAALSERAEKPVARPDAWATTGLAEECRAVREAPPGHHNEVLSRAAYRVGQIVGAGLLDHFTARQDLLVAAQHLVTADCGCTRAEVARVIDARLPAGMTQPRHPATDATIRKDAA
ncbi:bifunctional DNA primase/polymerase [Amycolatopsis cihanbeyliensis]|uniref:Bifunctional DNA primase/polymerase-like protein n=1 Tax=Amycolatopsis cihanbeyliensis TaxID=1128664 RepID=A0A542DJJ6_AMYCI|nr:bifunctional DNA primase/polymerase [Amycolatopsis cihanbeyliensis]TQJ03268.1 bifunctional DNA primase/polymerase-like protein [Amycolatopsis cihanbeyliensis]